MKYLISVLVLFIFMVSCKIEPIFPDNGIFKQVDVETIGLDSSIIKTSDYLVFSPKMPLIFKEGKKEEQYTKEEIDLIEVTIFLDTRNSSISNEENGEDNYFLESDDKSLELQQSHLYAELKWDSTAKYFTKDIKFKITTPGIYRIYTRGNFYLKDKGNITGERGFALNLLCKDSNIGLYGNLFFDEDYIKKEMNDIEKSKNITTYYIKVVE